MNPLTSEQLSYLAGFIDADGSIMGQFARNMKNPPTSRYSIRTTVQISQKVCRIHHLHDVEKMVGLGKASARKKGEMADWVLTEPRNVHKFLTIIKPYLKQKQKQANLVIRIIEQLPRAKESADRFMQVCFLVDHVSALNDSKVTKRSHTAATVIAYMTTEGGISPP
jgi:hypothetical protein